MSRPEQSIGKLDEALTKDEQGAAMKEVFDWLGTTTEIPPNAYSREWARELLAQIGALAMYDKYEGSADSSTLCPSGNGRNLISGRPPCGRVPWGGARWSSRTRGRGSMRSRPGRRRNS